MEDGVTNPLERLLATRYSCRAFHPDPVPDVVLRRLLTMAQRAPSWCNTQAWQVHLLSGEALVQFGRELGGHAASHPQRADLGLPTYQGVHAARRRESGYELYSALGIDRDDRDRRAAQAFKNFSFFGAPHSAIVTTDQALGSYGAVDCGAYVQTLMLAAQSLGLGVIAQGAIAMYSDFVHAWLDLPEDRMVVCAVSLGFADDSDPVNLFRTTRAPVDTVVHWIAE